MEVMLPEIHTSRLWLKPLRLADAAQIQQIFPQWEVVEFLTASVPWPYPDDGALIYCRDVALPAMERGDEWHWTIRRRVAAEQIIGAISLRKGEWINRGFWLAPAWHGRGLMSEAVVPVNNYWFDVLGFTRLRAPKAIGNGPSRRISEKTGMRVVAIQEHDYVSGRFPSEIWELTAEEWRAKRASLGDQAQAPESPRD